MTCYSASPMRALLHRSGLYDRLKASRLYDAYWWVRNRQILDAWRAEISFYRDVFAVGPGSLVFDIGANVGAKTQVFLRLGARVIAVDPDPANQATLARRFHHWRITPQPVAIVSAAVSDRMGTAPFHKDAPGSAKNTLSEKWTDILRADDRFGQPLAFADTATVPTTTLDHLIAEHGQPDVIKIDIEGHELAALAGLHHAVRALSFEVNLPEFLDEGRACVARLMHLSPRGRFNAVADIRAGLLLPTWLEGAAFTEWLSTCQRDSIDVVWTADGH